MGAAVIPGGLGLLVSWLGLEIVAPVLLLSAILMGAVMWKGRLVSIGGPTRLPTGGPAPN